MLLPCTLYLNFPLLRFLSFPHIHYSSIRSSPCPRTPPIHQLAPRYPELSFLSLSFWTNFPVPSCTAIHPQFSTTHTQFLTILIDIINSSPAVAPTHHNVPPLTYPCFPDLWTLQSHQTPSIAPPTPIHSLTILMCVPQSYHPLRLFVRYFSIVCCIFSDLLYVPSR